MKKHINIDKNKLLEKFHIIPISSLMIILAIWEIVVENGYIDRFILPSPSDIIVTLYEIIPAIKGHLLVTLQEAALGFIGAIIFAFVLAIMMDSIPLMKKAIYPLLVISQTVPIIVLAPLFSMWFGFGAMPKVVIVLLVCFFPIVVSFVEGLESVDKDMVNLLKSMGSNSLQVFRLVKLPASLGSLFSGLKVAATYSIMGAVIGEWNGGNMGLGLYMLRAKKSYYIEKVFAVIIIIVVISLLLFKLVSLIQRLLMPWTKEDNK